MEAEDLLRNIGTNLDIIAAEPANSDALWEIRRNAHTFKGAAGIVGFKKPSELAHRVEDLLDHLAENKISSNDAILELLRSATDCLNAMTNGENSPELAARTADVYSRFESMMTDLVSKPVAKKKVQKTASAAHVETAEEKNAQQMRRPRSIVRVSLGRLDELSRLVRDLVVSRSVFEQRLSDLEQQIDELHNSTRRLQQTNGKLEIEYEASMLSRTPSRGAGRFVFGASADDADEFDALEFDRYTDFHQCTRELAETTSDTFAINTELDLIRGNFESLFETQRRLIDEMQEKLTGMRMVEFGTMSTRLHRAVRVTCDEMNKKAEVVIENETLELDTQVLDSLIEPLLHVLRNAVVHGIEDPDTRRLLGKPEKGTIGVRISNEETHIALTVSDDGRGIVTSALKEKAVLSGAITRAQADAMTEEELLRLVFLPGLTTAEKLSLSAGRGVGMSIVKESIESHQGTITIRSEPQEGTRITLRVPLALAVTNVLLVKAAAQVFALPIKLIKNISETDLAGISTVDNERAIAIGGEEFEMLELADHIGRPRFGEALPDNIPTLLIETTDKACALTVDEILRSEEIVIKSLGKPLENLKGLLGAAMLANGDVVPILDLPYLLMNKMFTKVPAAAAVAEKPVEINVMIVDDSPSVRHMTSKVIGNAGWHVTTAKDGLEALEMLQSSRRLPDVILTDVEMPRMDGYEFVSSLKRSEGFAAIPVIMITSRAAEKHRQKAIDIGVDEYLPKPYDDQVLLDLIKNFASVRADVMV
jgi:chemosensory pili system protein ChpA (sensor histidine kinase/response regulator)